MSTRVPLPGGAGDVIFMHYLLVHSSANRAGHSEPAWTPLDWTLGPIMPGTPRELIP